MNFCETKQVKKKVKSKVLFLQNIHLYPTRSSFLQDNMGAYIYSQNGHNFMLSGLFLQRMETSDMMLGSSLPNLQASFCAG